MRKFVFKLYNNIVKQRNINFIKLFRMYVIFIFIQKVFLLHLINFPFQSLFAESLYTYISLKILKS